MNTKQGKSINRRAFVTISLLIASAALAFAEISITGAGATFPNPIYQKWFSEYHKAHPDVQINYQSLGSGAGVKQVTEGTVDFGAADSPMTDAQIAEYQKKQGSTILHFPTVLGAAVATYNVPGLNTGLNLTPDALAGIFLGKITKWNDPAIANENKSLKLPSADIIVVHRSDSSGTTYVWTDYLCKVSGDWKSHAGAAAAAVKWPTGIGGKGNDGVSGQVKNLRNSIGYVELVYAEQNKLPFANIRNAAGVFIKPDLASITAAAASVAQNIPDDFRVSITNAPGKTAYPISTFTWLLIPQQFKEAEKGKIMKDFLKWALGPGQNWAEPLSYAKLPTQVVAKELKAIAKVK
jgi:phosphate transport system substrate-binding protein